MAIVGIILSGILPVFLNVITYNKEAEYRSAAYKLADSKLEALRYGAFDSIPVSSDTEANQLPGGHVIVTSTNLIDGVAQTNIKKVDVRVAWNFKRNQEVKLVTYIASNGIKK